MLVIFFGFKVNSDQIFHLKPQIPNSKIISALTPFFFPQRSLHLARRWWFSPVTVASGSLPLPVVLQQGSVSSPPHRWSLSQKTTFPARKTTNEVHPCSKNEATFLGRWFQVILLLANPLLRQSSPLQVTFFPFPLDFRFQN